MCSNPLLNFKFPNTTLNYYFSDSARRTKNQIKTLILQRPISISLNADDFTTFAPRRVGQVLRCNPLNSARGRQHNHAVFLVGWTTDAWIIKNSWGTDWGNAGYVNVSMNTNYDCGIGFGLYSLTV